MAIKTFTTGEVLTASDTNTYLNNGGLVYVSSGTFTNATTVDITGFVSDYTLFRVFYEAYRHSGTGLSDITATYRNSSTAMTAVYYGCAFYMNYVAGTGAIKARNAGADFYIGDVYTGTGATPTRCTFDVGGMNQTTLRPSVSGSFWSYGQTANVVFGYDNNANNIAPDRIRLSCAVGITGKWRVYGYREP